MLRTTRRSVLALGGLAAGVATLAAVSIIPAGSQENPVTVTGQAVCSTAGPVGRYQLDWTVTNNLTAPVTDGAIPVNQPADLPPPINAVNIASATESGAFTGTVTITPNPIDPKGTGTGSDGPVGGTTTGTVTLTVVWSYYDGNTTVEGQSTGTITLDGTCTIPTSSSSSTTTTAAVNNQVTPAFTG